MDVKPRKLSDSERTFLLDSIDSWIDGLPDSPAVMSIRRSIFKKLRARTRDPKLALQAKHKFLETEVKCKATNARVSLSVRGVKPYGESDVLYIASRKISQILGNFSVDEMLTRARFGKGATFRCRGTDVSKARKFGLTDVSAEFKNLASSLLAAYPLWAGSLADTDLPVCPVLEPVPGGRYASVPKDQTTDRSIIIEPTINSWFQQGIGRTIRARLKHKVAVDLSDQTVNRELAKLGSLTDDLATVDLSSASDLISTKLVYDLLPPDWYYWLDITRSRRVLVDGEWHVLEKFSSMGNGFTFDLQSLIFYALGYAVASLEGYNPYWVNVFGDDIVIPSGIKDRFLKLFDACGFEPNVNKSFFEGPFRESCGHDYYLGKNIRGVYLHDLETDIDVLKVHNRFYEWACRSGVEWSELRGVFLLFLDHIKARVPPILGDLGVTSSFDEVCPPVARTHKGTEGWEGFRIKILTPVLLTEQRSDRFLLLDRLQGSEDQGNTVALRQDILGYRYREAISLWE
jgi:hypothetical protein